MYQYGSSAYQYPASSYNNPYGTSTGMSQYPPSTSYTYPQSSYSQPSSIPTYDSKSYMETLPQPGAYPTTYNGSTTAASGYQYNYDTQTYVPNTATNTTVTPTPTVPKEVKEIDIDFDEEHLETIYSPDDIVDRNKLYFEEIISETGTLSLL